MKEVVDDQADEDQARPKGIALSCCVQACIKVRKSKQADRSHEGEEEATCQKECDDYNYYDHNSPLSR